jgi:hypothetical protein
MRGGQCPPYEAELATLSRTDYSDAWPLATQRRYCMQYRSPIIFWLLLAATFSVDAVVGYWMAADRYSTANLDVVFFALIMSQLSIVCIWSATKPAKTVASQIFPFATIAVASLLGAWLDTPSRFLNSLLENLIAFGIQAALLVAALWVLQRTRFWQRRTGIRRPWRYSLAHLLVIMTVVALLAGLFRASSILSREPWSLVAIVVASVLLAVVSVFFWSLSWHGLLRIAAVIGSAMMIGLAVFLAYLVETDLSGYASVMLFIYTTFFLIQGIVLSVWLGLGPILPVSSAGANASQS